MDDENSQITSNWAGHKNFYTIDYNEQYTLEENVIEGVKIVQRNLLPYLPQGFEWKKILWPSSWWQKKCISWNISLKKKIIFILIIYSFILIKSYKNRTRKFEKLAFYFQDEWSSFLRENSSFTQRIVEYFGWFMRIVNMRKTFAVILPNVLIISFEMESN